MRPCLTSPQGMAALNRLLRGPALIAFDFDGTLARICANPHQVSVHPTWVKHLKQINQRWPLAVISGRQLKDLAPRLGFEPAFIAGNHGAESAVTQSDRLTPQFLDEARKTLAKHQEKIASLSIEVEDKGLSLAVHYRRSDVPRDAAVLIADLLASLSSALQVSHGRAVFNITMRDLPNKGDALMSAMRLSGVEDALYVGDDSNDEAAFSAASPRSVTIKIGSTRLPTAARFALPTQRQLGRVLRMLASRSA